MDEQVSAKTRARAEQAALQQMLPRMLRTALERLEASERRIVDGELALMDVPRRPRGRYRLRLRWETAPGSVAALEGPDWIVERHDGRARRQRPDSRILRSVYPDTSRVRARDLRDAIEAAIDRRVSIARALGAAVAELPAPATRELLIDPYAPAVPQRLSWAREAIAERRRIVEAAVQATWDAIHELQVQEEVIDEAMRRFNACGGWHRNLVVRWSTRGSLRRSVLRLRGPELCRSFTNTEARYPERLAALSGSGGRRAPRRPRGRPPAIVTRERIREARQQRYAARLERAGGEIQRAARRREQIGRVLQRMRHHLQQVVAED